VTAKEIIDGLKNLAEFLESKSGDGPDSIFNSGFFDDDIKTLREAVRMLQENQSPKSEWQSVVDALPDTGEPVIIAIPKDGGARVEQGVRFANGWLSVYSMWTEDVTHWMPFPKPPEEATT